MLPERNTQMKTAIVAITALAVLIGIPMLMYVSYNNNEVELRNQAGAQQKKCELVFDQVWKILQQKAGVTSEYKNAFMKIYPQLMDARYSNESGSLLAKFVTESNPNFDTILYKDLMVSIEAQRTTLTREQAALLDIKREHDNLRMKIPGSFFVGSRAALEIKIVTSSKTDEAFATGKEENVDLFNKQSAEAK